jgi:4-hydroxy-tetrahydrodipicolinate synthase
VGRVCSTAGDGELNTPRGAYAPIPTPVDRAGRLDLPALARHLERLDRGGLDGVLVLGTNGEFPSFDVTERLAVAECAARSAGRLDLMLGVGSCALPEVHRFVAAASELGYDAVLLPPPFYFRNAPTAGVAAFVLKVLDRADLPVLLYHIPQVTGVPISDELLDAVADHPRFAGVKDSSGRDDELARLAARLGSTVYMVGNDRLVSTAVAAGGGSITAAASVAPELVAAAHRDSSRQAELDRVRSLLEAFGLGPAVKAILRRKGIGDYRARPPLLDLDDRSAEELIAQFERLLGS